MLFRPLILLLFALSSPALLAQGAAPAAADAEAPASTLPTKGSAQAAVLEQFGEPTVRHKPVGGGSRLQPPITRWDYETFSVFFENDHVVDAVQRANPAPVRVRDGLTVIEPAAPAVSETTP